MRNTPLLGPVSLSLFVFFSVPGSAVHACSAQLLSQQVTLPAGTVLRLALSERTSIGHVGQPVEATVVEPVYQYDRLLIPASTRVQGTITRLDPVPRAERIVAMTGGDFTPLHDPVLQFDRLVLRGVEIPIDTEAVKRNTELVRLQDPQLKGVSVFAQMKSKLRETVGAAEGGPTRIDCLKNLLFSSLPYHPQVLDRGSLFDAVLQQPVDIAVPSEEPVDLSHIGGPVPGGTLAHARLITGLDSTSATEGMRIEAVLTEPIYGSNHELLYPEGTEMLGDVIRAHRAGWFSRGGELRFAFRSLRPPTGVEQRISGQIGGLEAQQDSNVTIDAEGGTKAHMGARYLAPVYSALFAAMGTDPENSRIRRTAASDGFRLLGRIAGMAGPPGVSTGLSYYGYARSLCLHLLRKGPEISFPANTRLEIVLTPRTGTPLNMN